MQILNHSLVKKALAFWFSIAPKERRYVSILGLFLLVLGIYYGIVSPVNTTLQDLKQRISYQQNLLNLMKPAAAEIQGLKKGSTPSNTVSSADLLSTISSDLTQNNLNHYATEVSQSTNSGVQIKFSAIPFDQLTQWLVDLAQTNQIHVSQLSLQKASALGTVNVTLTLRVSA